MSGAGNASMKLCRERLLDIFDSAVAGVNPHDSVMRCLSREDDVLTVENQGGFRRTYRLSGYRHVNVVGCGKAVVPMAQAVEAVCGDRLTEGVIVTKQDHAGDWSSPRIRVHEASHPTPDERGVAGAAQALDLLQCSEESDLVVALISGGGSALWPLPQEGICLAEKSQTTTVLLGCGADIEQMNCVRKHISGIKGGWAAQAAYPAEVLVLVISDVIGDPLDVIASGPFCPDPTTYQDALKVMHDRDVWARMPGSVRRHIERGVAGAIPETPKEDAVCFQKVDHVMCATNEIALRWACRKATELGYDSRVVNTRLSGEARSAAESFCEQVLEASRSGTRPLCLISGGETTVTLGTSHGKGGRNQEFALAAALCLDNHPGIALLSCGTDGTDGPTDAAGAIVDGSTAGRARERGLEPYGALREHASYSFFDTLGDLIKTGPTQTNVMDIQVAIIE